MRALRHFALLVALVASSALAATAPGPEAFVSLHGAVDDTVEVGEPLFVAVRFDISEGTLVLAPAGKAWVDAVQVTLTGSSVSLVGLPAEKPAPGPVTLDEENAASAEWYFPAKIMSQLTPGTYVAKARLAITDGSGWKGEVESDEITVRVVAQSTTFARVLQRTAAEAAAALAANAPEEAARILDVVLTAHPDELRLLLLRARAAAQGGDVQSALACVYRAGDAVSALKLTHPPLALYELKQQLLAAAFDPSYDPPKPPAWTKPPAAVLEPVRPKASTAAAAAPSKTSTPAPAVASAPAPTPSAPPAPAANPTPATTVAASAPTPAAPATKPVIPESVAPPPAPSTGGQPVSESALDDAAVRADPRGQWASAAKAGSQYSTPEYGAQQMIGAPDITESGNNSKAWCPGVSTGREWAELTFARPVKATEVRFRQNNAPGSIVKVEAIDSGGKAHTWWEGTDPARGVATSGAIHWFAIRVPATDYPVAKIKVTLDLDAFPGWKEIDAVQLVEAAP